VISKVAFAGGRMTLTRDLAERILESIRSEVAHGKQFDRVIAPYIDDVMKTRAVLTWAAKFLTHERDRLEIGDVAPRTVRELERMLKAGGVFSFWEGRSVDDVNIGALDEWRIWLTRGEGRGRGKRSPKTISNVLAELHRMLRWMQAHGEIDALPAFPKSKLEKNPPEVFTDEAMAAALSAVPREDRGLYLALAHGIRPGEARALDLVHWQAPDLRIVQSMDASAASAGIKATKARRGRVVAVTEELAKWVEWRVGRASKAERMKREGVPLFPNRRARSSPGRFSHWAVIDRWKTACKAAGVPYLSPYHLKHTIATKLAKEAPARIVADFLGHADVRSTEPYLSLAGSGKSLLRDSQP
jgi:integrase